MRADRSAEDAMKTLLRMAPLSGAALLAACTYGIVLDSGGEGVRTLWNGDASGCRDIGKVTVSVLSRVGPIDRNDIKVRDELEIMARNQAAGMHDDAITPLGDPQDGAQSWEAWQCGTSAAPASTAYPPQGSGAPVQDVPTAPSSPPPDEATTPAGSAQPAPFSAPAPAGSGAQTYPASSRSR